MRKLIPIFILSLFTLVARAADVVDMRVWHAPTNSRVVFDVDGALAHDLFTLSKPNRIVVDLVNGAWKTSIPAAANDASFILNVRTGTPKENVRRIVFEVEGDVRAESMLLAPTGDKGYRLVVDLFPNKNKQVTKADNQPNPPKKPAGNTQKTTRPGTPNKENSDIKPAPKPRAILVAVDAGHGGEDPGAVGKNGTYEKNVVLAIAKKVKNEIDKRPNMEAFLTRTGDYYIPLRKRTKMALDKGADIFVSIHADAALNRSAKGSSVYTLSLTGASSEQARLLAENENKADIIAGVSLQNRDPVLTGVLVEKALANTMSTSRIMASEVLKGLGKIGPLHSKRVEQAGFVVLKNAETLSMLVETAYISNPTQEKQLKKSSYQQQLATSITDGIERFVKTTNYRFYDRTASTQ